MIEPCAVPVTRPARGPEDRVVRLRRERPERRRADVRAHRVRAVLGARRRVREVVAPLALDHPGAFDPAGVPLLVELADPLPGVGVGRERDELLRLADRAGRIGGVELDAVDSRGLGAAPVEEQAAVVVHEEHRIDRIRQAGRQLRAAELLERTQRRGRRVDGRRAGHQEEPVALPHHGRRVADVADVERVVLPRRAHVGADPGHVHRRVEDPPAVVPDGRRVRQLAVLLDAVDEPQERPVGLVAVSSASLTMRPTG